MASSNIPTILIDCRWTNSGAGRITELLLRGLSQGKNEFRWRLWGPRRIERLAWPGAEVIISTTDPTAMRGQRSFFSIPDCDLVLFMHQQRPLRQIPSVTLMYDTIPLRFAKNPVDRRAKLIFMKRVAAISQQVITISAYSRDCLVRDLQIGPDHVHLVRLPFDDSFANRILTLRSQTETRDIALFVGRFLPHKNLEALVSAFGQTRFQRTGGKLLLVGGSDAEVRRLESRLTPLQKTFVELRGKLDQSQLDLLFANSLFLVQPSLEEGFGLPAWEALCCGLPVCASEGGSLPEATRGMVELFPPSSISAMTAALDRCAGSAREGGEKKGKRISEELRRHAPTVAEYGEEFTEIIRRNLSLG